jgi:hypothetical protein
MAIEAVLPQVAAAEVAGIAMILVAVPDGFPVVPDGLVPVEVAVHTSGLARGSGLGGRRGSTHDQQGCRKGKQ